MTGPFTAACIQLRTGLDVAANIEASEALIRDAAARGAHYIQTPEMTNILAARSKELFARIVPEAEDETLKRFRALAAELGVWLHAGSLAVRVDEGKAANRGFLIAPDGSIAARYDKIHMFDVDLPDGETYRESKNYRPGGEAVIADLPWARLGLTICYDLRFAYLYRALAHAGADIVAVPSAFTEPTGAAHWHVLVRARAIETGAFIIAAAQGGAHESGRKTYGHSLIVAPWGEIIAEADNAEPGIVVAEIDPALCAKARGRVPALQHDRKVTLRDATARAAE